MIDIPDMPTDWWPDTVIVHATTIGTRARQIELCFAITSQDTASPEFWTANIDALRLALWQAKHDPNLAEEMFT